MKPHLAYIDYSFHKKTRSTFFLREILNRDFQVTNIWDESWRGDNNLTAEEINRGKFEYVLFFQSLMSYKELKQIKAKIIWVPMYDGVDFKRRSVFLGLSTLGVKIINFSKTLEEFTRQFEIKSKFFQYFPETNYRKVENYNRKVIYFWQRRNYPNFTTLKKLIGRQKIDEIIYKAHPDPGIQISKISKADIKKYQVEIINDFQSQADYQRTLEKCNIYFAPRELEGIGMPVLEAMQRGMAVIALNNPTMNEYIKNDMSGYLFRKGRESEINFSRLKTLGANARRRSTDGLARWQKEQAKISQFIFGPWKKNLAGSWRKNLTISVVAAAEFPGRVERYLLRKVSK